MEIKTGPKSEPCGTPPVMWVALLILDPDNKTFIYYFIPGSESTRYNSKQTN